MPKELSPTQAEKIKMLGDMSKRGEIALLDRLFELQEALKEAQMQLEYITAEQERDKTRVITIDQPPVDINPVIEALQALQNALPKPEKPQPVDISPVVDAIRDLQNTISTEQQFSDSAEEKDYTEMLGKLLEALNKPNREQEIIDLLGREYPTFEIPSYLINNGRIKVEVDRTGGGIASRLHDARGVAIDPATRQNQETLIAETATNYAVIVDDATPTTSYVGEAVIGSATSGAVWRIKRLVCVGNVLTVTWADGNDSYDNIWNNRATITYS